MTDHNHDDTGEPRHSGPLLDLLRADGWVRDGSHSWRTPTDERVDECHALAWAARVSAAIMATVGG